MITVQEAKKAIEELKAQGTSEEDLLGILYHMYQKSEIDLDEFTTLTDALGYELTEEFVQASDENKKNFFDFGGQENVGETGQESKTNEENDDEDDTKDQNDDSQNDGQGDKPSEENQGQDKEEGKQPDQSDSKEPGKEDDDELKEARKLYGFDK